MTTQFEEFTETGYRCLLRLAKARWQLSNFADYKKAGKICLWRHDIDFSVHRAYRLAQIEMEEGVKATYFIHLHNMFYNLLEDTNMILISRIRDLGHDIGLHFDPAFWAARIETENDMNAWLTFEQKILQQTFQVEIRAFSFHNPNIGNWLSMDKDEMSGMINAYGRYFKQNYGYCSDSNGYWRFSRLKDVLEMGRENKLQVLTHPAWWTLDPMSPRVRISRCIDGRAKRQHRKYDEFLEKTGRINISALQ